ncbi:MAG: 8-oxoguanine DNA glycosylase [Clostridia bacterium]|nr:8-oxoguanine DNA glycosylase [Clostridia bacterium]
MENITKTYFKSEYFNVKDTLECGQIFRFTPYKKGYKIFSKDKCAYVYNERGCAVVEGDLSNGDYFENLFDVKRDYESIVNSAKKENVKILSIAAERGKGIRILNQDSTEMLFSFIVSQNNNIPRIKSIIEKLCTSLGAKKDFNGEEYFAFPTPEIMAKRSVDFYKSIGLGYRAEYIKNLAEMIVNGFDVNNLVDLPTVELKKRLMEIKGVGPKVADCVALFGFHRSDSFPVDTWIEKVYREDFKGTIKDRAKIAVYLVSRFGKNAGYYQQYLFHYKRMLEK